MVPFAFASITLLSYPGELLAEIRWFLSMVDFETFHDIFLSMSLANR